MGIKKSLSAPPDARHSAPPHSHHRGSPAPPLTALSPRSWPPPRSGVRPPTRPKPAGCGGPGAGGAAGSPPCPRPGRSPAAAILVPMETAARAGSEGGSGGWRTAGPLWPPRLSVALHWGGRENHRDEQAERRPPRWRRAVRRRGRWGAGTAPGLGALVGGSGAGRGRGTSWSGLWVVSGPGVLVQVQESLRFGRGCGATCSQISGSRGTGYAIWEIRESLCLRDITDFGEP